MEAKGKGSSITCGEKEPSRKKRKPKKKKERRKRKWDLDGYEDYGPGRVGRRRYSGEGEFFWAEFGPSRWRETER